jgi:hypothetical protein
MVFGGERHRRTAGPRSDSQTDSERRGGNYRVSAQQDYLKGARRALPYIFNPDSAVAIDATSEERNFRSKANSSLPLSGLRSSVVDWKSKTSNRVRKRETILKLHGWVSSLLQARPSLVLAVGSSANPGLMRDAQCRLLVASPIPPKKIIFSDLRKERIGDHVFLTAREAPCFFTRLIQSWL